MITDAAGCTTETDINLAEPGILGLAIVIDSVPSCSSATGAATGTATGGTSPYTYLWSNASTSSSTGPIGAGIYTLTATDVNGCSVSATVAIVPALGSISLSTTITQPLCFGSLGSVSFVPMVEYHHILLLGMVLLLLVRLLILQQVFIHCKQWMQTVARLRL